MNRWGLSVEDLESGNDGAVASQEESEGNGVVEKISTSSDSKGSGVKEEGKDSFSDEGKESISSDQVGISGSKYEIRDEEPEEGKEESQEETEGSEKEPKVTIETEAKEEETEENPYATVMQELVNNDLLEHDEEKDYKGTSEELMEMIDSSAEKKANQKFENLIESVDDKRNREVLEAMRNGASFEDAIAIAQEEDFSSWDLKNVNNQANAVGLLMEKRNPNDDQETIKAKIQAFHKAGILEQESKKAIKELDGLQKENKESYYKNIEKAEKERQETLDQEAQEFEKDLLSRKEIAGFEVTDKENKELLDFISVEDGEGKTAFEKKEEENKDSKLLYAYFLMKGMNKDALTKGVRKKETFKIKKKLDNFQDTKAEISGGGNRGQSNESDYVSISDFGGFNYNKNE